MLGFEKLRKGIPVKDQLVTDPVTGLPTSERVASGHESHDPLESGGYMKPPNKGLVEQPLPNILKEHSDGE